ncbi:hypothetical protein YC2023_067258 [Brassica napus]
MFGRCVTTYFELSSDVSILSSVKLFRAGKIESRRVLAGRGRNTLQRRSTPEELGTGLPGQATSQEAARKGEECGNVDGKEGNAPETHGTSNGTHGDVGKVDMCVLNPAPRNPGRKWGRGGCFNWYQSQVKSVLKENSNSSESPAKIRSTKKSSYRGVVEF